MPVRVAGVAVCNSRSLSGTTRSDDTSAVRSLRSSAAKPGMRPLPVAITWVILLLSIEGLVRGQFLSVLLRMLFVVLLLVGVYYFVKDWRYVFAFTFYAAAALLLVVNLRDAWKR